MATLTMTQPRSGMGGYKPSPGQQIPLQDPNVLRGLNINPDEFSSMSPNSRMEMANRPSVRGQISEGFRPQQSPAQNQGSFVRPEAPAREASPFMQQFEEQIKILDPEQRDAFVQTASQNISDRLARYNYRLSRGRELNGNQQAEYDALLASLGDIQDYQYSLKAIPEGLHGFSGFEHPSYNSMANSNVAGERRGKPYQFGTPSEELQGRTKVTLDNIQRQRRL